MKNIDERFFNFEGKDNIVKEEDLLNPDEKILWKSQPKKLSYILSMSSKLIPFAIIWLLFDLFAIVFSFASMLSSSENTYMLLILIPFFALHLTPVWLCIGTIVKASKEVKYTTYIITNFRAIEISGKDNKYIVGQLSLVEMTEANLKESLTDRLLKCGDIYIKDINRNTLIFFDVSNPEFITSKISAICGKKNAYEEFYDTHYECSHCLSYIDSSRKKCPNCGAPVKKDN